MIQDLTNSLKNISLNLVQQNNQKKAYTVESDYNLTNQNQERNRKEDPNQDLEIIKKIYLEVKKSIKEILEIIIDMIEADLKIIINMIETDLEVKTTSTNYWDTLLNNTSIRGALTNYLQDNSNIYQTTIRNKLFIAIIDNRAAISIIIQQAAKKIGLEIDTSSNSLISFVLGKQVRPLSVIKDISVIIARITISISIKVVPATTYSLILENDCHHIIVLTTYEHNQVVEGQLIVSKVDDNWEEEYEDEELISHEAYTLEAESNNIKDSG
ncbi:28586_t:CDS:2 [Racocetra persica]|uniref:28586_t:CDS:1 n=1 Tax=Racocetra persica TaxID=160502 RepID=A0ACA9LST6_9GLOM|nr:28586_t:CDS:2 [Racocetra persica]